MGEHTPGPWELCDFGDYGDFDGRSRVICGDDIRLAVVQVPSDDDIEGNANARLIAAAPELLAALEEAHDVLHRTLVAFVPSNDRAYEYIGETMSNMRSAIAKARPQP